MSTANRVALFNYRCGKMPAPVGTSEFFQALEDQAERIQEELNELLDAIKEQNYVEIADAICDLDVVVGGAGYLSGSNINGAVNAVLDNNDAKYSANKAFIDASTSAYNSSAEGKEEFTTVASVQSEQHPTVFYSVRRVSDNKIMKPTGHPKVDLTPYVAVPQEQIAVAVATSADEERAREIAGTFQGDVLLMFIDDLPQEQKDVLQPVLDGTPTDYICLRLVNGNLEEAFTLADEEVKQ